MECRKLLWISSDRDEFELKTNQVTREWDGILRVREDYILTIEAELRDREFSETVREFMNWLCRLSKRVFVTDICVKIHDKLGKMLSLTDPGPFAEMEEAPSGLKLHGESAWWECLLWEKDPFSDRPLWHAYKYGNDPRIREEIERRRRWHDEFDANLAEYMKE